jgi:hypothetical protein
MHPVTIERKIEFKFGRKTAKQIMLQSDKVKSGKDTLEKPKEEGRVPRIAKLMALAIRFQNLIDTGEVFDQADLAHIGNVTRARITQIMSLLYLAPDLQQTLLFLPRTIQGRDPIRERHIRPLAAELEWRKQWRLWKALAFDQKAGLVGEDA